MEPTQVNSYYSPEYMELLRKNFAVLACLKTLHRPRDMIVQCEISYGHTKVRHGASWDNPDDWHWQGRPGISRGHVLYPANEFHDACVVANLLGITLEIVPGSHVCAIHAGAQSSVMEALTDWHWASLTSGVCRAVCELCVRLEESWL